MDKARKATDKELRRIEKKLKKIYKEAEKDVPKQWKQFMKESEEKIKEFEEEYKKALETKDAKKIRRAKKRLQDEKVAQTLMNDRYKAIVDDVATRLANVNAVALAYTTSKMADIYVINHNVIAPTAESLGIDFTIVNERAVRNMIKNGDIKLPKHLNTVRDKRWNTKQINSQVLQGIIQGESTPKIADRLYSIVDRNEASAVRYARTITTSVENQGRFDSYKELQETGAVAKKVWTTAGDDRVRESHALMEGERAEIDEPFSNKLMFPGDMNGDDPGEIWNCRCGMDIDIIGFKDDKGRIHYI